MGGRRTARVAHLRARSAHDSSQTAITALYELMQVQGGGPQSKQDANTFEAAQKSWSQKSVSSRGKVGAAGDNSGFSWLG